MLRAIAGVIVGYITMFVFIFVTFTIAYLLMGADRAFREGAYEVSWFWIAISMVLGTTAALAGGAVCRLIAGSMTPVYALAGLVLVLGIIFAIPVLTAEPAGPRTGDVPNMQAMAEARQPAVAALANPIIGALGAAAGGMLVGRRRSTVAQAHGATIRS